MFGFVCVNISSQTVSKEAKEYIERYFEFNNPDSVGVACPKLKDIEVDAKRKRVDITFDKTLEYRPFREDFVSKAKKDIQKKLGRKFRGYDINIYTNNAELFDLIPNFYRSKNRQDRSRLLPADDDADFVQAWTRNDSRPIVPTEGLEGRHISLWQSHGIYYKEDKNEWRWQRPALFGTREDLLTQSFVLPYLIPMLERAGAVVFTPRERDVQTYEVIVDNDVDNRSVYRERNSRSSVWQTAPGAGFGMRKFKYMNGENPFEHGTARLVESGTYKQEAVAEWIPDIPETGEYAVYVSYKTVEGSTQFAHYRVYHAGGVTDFTVNQTIGGGTWVYLGTFRFDKGVNSYGMVALSNVCDDDGVVTADAVRFGGGMGNIMRGGEVSGRPRYLEGARYYAQWAGMPDSIYNGYDGHNDYADDINTRSKMTNYLSGGSAYNPGQAGCKVPFELSLGIHSDAGVQPCNKFVGTLGIYTTDKGEKLLGDGRSRYTSRDLTDMTLTNVTSDLSALLGRKWRRRSMFNKNYSETRIPRVPSMILEMFSHQNPADLQYAMNPNFKFDISRAVYKSILQFLALQHGTKYTVQPLPVTHFSAEFGRQRNEIVLRWHPQEDRLEKSAKPEQYIVYMRIGSGSFDNGTLVNGTTYSVQIEPDIVYSFKVTAVNKGGESMDSEILAVCKRRNERGKVLIVNGFDRLAAPYFYNTPDSVGFDIAIDPGVSYKRELTFTGRQLYFNPDGLGKEGPCGLGNCLTDIEGSIIAGNTFDYTFVHGKAIQAAGGLSFVSSSDEAVESGMQQLKNYDIVDYICGLEKEDNSYPGKSYKTFSPVMQQKITEFCSLGRGVMVSGSFIASDMQTQDEREFTSYILHYGLERNKRNDVNEFVIGLDNNVSIQVEADKEIYQSLHSDRILPVGEGFIPMIYSDNGGAAVAYKGSYRTFSMSFPFEIITSAEKRSQIMASIMNFLLEKKRK
jgi:hypothetical protein